MSKNHIRQIYHDLLDEILDTGKLEVKHSEWDIDLIHRQHTEIVYTLRVAEITRELFTTK